MLAIRKLFQPTDTALIALACGSGVYTYLGCRQILDGNSLFTFLAALVYAGCVSLMIALFWMWATRVLPTTNCGKRLLIASLTVLVGAILISFASSSFNMMAISGPAATNLHESRALEAAEQQLATTYSATLQIRDLLPDLRSDTERFERLSADERQHGRFTQRPGDGAVADLFDQVSKRLRRLADDVAASLDDIEELRLEADSLIAAMRETATDVGMRRRERFRQLAMDLYAVIAQIRAATPAGTIERTADFLVSELVMLPTAANPALAATQRKAADQITATLTNTARKYGNRARDIAKLLDTLPDRPNYVPIHAMQAIFIYAGEFMPAWIGAIAIDLMPLVVLIFIAIAEKNANSGEYGARNPALDLSMEDYIKFRELEQNMRDSERADRGRSRRRTRETGQATSTASSDNDNVRSIHHEHKA